MPSGNKVKPVSTNKKDEAAFYLSELAKGLLRNQVKIGVGDHGVVAPQFDAMRLEIETQQSADGYMVDIRLSWRAQTPPTVPPNAGDERLKILKRNL